MGVWGGKGDLRGWTTGQSKLWDQGRGRKLRERGKGMIGKQERGRETGVEENGGKRTGSLACRTSQMMETKIEKDKT